MKNTKLLSKISLFGLIGASLMMSGCATILNGKTQQINLESSKQTTASINGRQYNSPSVVTINRSDKDAFIVNEECNKTVLLQSKVSPTFFVNILSGGVFGSTTDYSSGSMWEYSPTNVNLDCK